MSKKNDGLQHALIWSVLAAICAFMTVPAAIAAMWPAQIITYFLEENSNPQTLVMIVVTAGIINLTYKHYQWFFNKKNHIDDINLFFAAQYLLLSPSLFMIVWAILGFKGDTPMVDVSFYIFPLIAIAYILYGRQYDRLPKSRKSKT